MERGQRAKLNMYDCVCNLKWYQKLYIRIILRKENIRYRKFCEAYKQIKKYIE
jgi:hypothetical protein